MATGQYNRFKSPKDPDSELKAFLNKIKPVAESGKNANYARLYAQLKGYLDYDKEGGADNLRPSDYIEYARDLKKILEQEREDTGRCPVCHIAKDVCETIRLHTEPEYATDRKVEALGLSL